jgi:acyl-coenzyme A synthetase/AMP-(fatty) acid ligase
MNITAPLRRNAQLFPEKTAIFVGDRGVSYGELDRQVDAAAARIAARLAGAGPGPGGAVAVLLADRYRHLVLTLALARIGMAAVLSSHIASRPGKMALKASFVDPGPAVAGRKAAVPLDDAWWRDLSAATPVASIAMHAGANAACLIGSSSGTTGTPKGMVLSHALIARRAAAKPLSIPWPAEPRLACTLGRESTYGFICILRALWTGGVLAFPSLASGLRAQIPQHRLNCLVMSPAQMHALVEALPADAAPFASLEVVEVGGGMLPARLAGAARARICANILVNYGAQETGSVASAPLSLLERHEGSVGFVLPGVEMQAVDDAGAPLAPGLEGSLRIRSPNAIAGYLDDPASSARAFRDGWFYPGDTGAVSITGMLTLAGRSDELLNAGGVKISALTIENAALQHADVAEAAAFSAPDPASGLPQIWLALVQRKDFDMCELGKQLVRALGQARVPRGILLLKSLPRNDNGKVQREQLVKLAAAPRGAPAAKAPSS